MMWYQHGMAGYSFAGALLGLFLLAVAVSVVLYAVRGARRPLAGHDPHDPEDLLAERYAHGYIDDEEYQRRLHVLRGR